MRDKKNGFRGLRAAEKSVNLQRENEALATGGGRSRAALPSSAPLPVASGFKKNTLS